MNAANLLDIGKMKKALEHYSSRRGSTAASPQLVLRPAAVLIPLLRLNGDWHVLYTRRTDLVESHKGQVSFPGGAADPGDSGPVDTALREAREEIGLQPECIMVIGSMPEVSTNSGFCITPVVGNICWPTELFLEEDEVSRVFTIPLNWLADPGHSEERLYTRSNGSQEMVVFYQPYDDEVVWGVTGRLTRDLVRALYDGE